MIERNPQAWRDIVLDTRTEASPGEVMTPEELECMKLAGRDAGSYLMEIGKTDLKELSKDEWAKFSSVMILGYELHLASRNHGVCA